INQQSSQENNFTDTQEDKKNSDPVEKTEYHTDPAVITGDFDKDGILDDVDTDDDNDGLLDAHETQQGSNTQDTDSDNDGAYHFPSDPASAAIDDFYDAFPNQADNSADPLVFGLRSHARDSRETIIRSYNIESDVRSEILELVSETRERQRDAIVDSITDAQIHKVLTDVNGYRVRMEEYIFRPTDRKIVCLNLCLRTAEAGDLRGVTSLWFEVEFAQAINSLPFETIKDFDWDTFFSCPDAVAYASEPAYYPANAFMEFKNPHGTTVRFNRDFDDTIYYESYSGYWYQTIISNTISRNGGTGLGINILPGVMGNPCTFYFWNGEAAYYAAVKVHHINESGQLVGEPFSVLDIFDDVVSGGDFDAVGNFYDIQIWAPDEPWETLPSITGTPDFDLVYMPPGDVPEYP
ncbi:MAG: hypothetical protein JW788_04550, partial [Candidatus Omnitrophica bacterium]|nr:hypothetical protein [Candidatus Omnitrophota bacterium]